MNHRSWHRLKYMHNIINSPTIIGDTKGRRMTKFASKQGRRWNHYHLTYDWNMSALTTPKCFITERTKFSQSSYTHHKWPKQWVFLKLSPNNSFILVVTNLLQTWPSYFLSMPCNWEGLWAFKWMGNNLNKTSPLKAIGKNWTFHIGILS